jgi:hypothetical protein
MRVVYLTPVFWLACIGSDGHPAITNTTPTEEADTATYADADTDTDADTGTDTGPTATDTGAYTTVGPGPAMANLDVFGSGTVDGTTYTGQRTYRYTDRRDGTPVCEWVFDAYDWHTAGEPGEGPSSAVPCTDYDGNPCDFTFDLRLIDGRDAGNGANCTLFTIGAGVEDLGTEGLGHIDNYFGAGVDYGPGLMYFIDYARFYPELPPGEDVVWLGLAYPSSFDGTEWRYHKSLGPVPYTP